MITEINNYDDWWQMVNDYWDDLCSTMFLYVSPTAAATKDCTGDSLPINMTIYEDLVRCKKEYDPKLKTYLFAAWDLAPDKPHIHSNPAWSQLCLLLSEEWALFERELK